MAAIGCLACAGCDAVGKKLANAGAGILGGVVIVLIILMVVCWIGDETPSDEELHDRKRKQENDHRNQP